MNLRTAVIIATKDRPKEIASLLDTLARQSVAPDEIIVSACNPEDVPVGHVFGDNVEVLFGSAGSSAQRNRGLSRVRGKADVIVFFDDDFIPSRFWIERVQRLLATQPKVGCVTGRVLADGVASGGLEWSYGQSLVDDEDRSSSPTMTNKEVEDAKSPYGCNMAFRAKAIEDFWFDERLVLYGWLEDRDFGFRVATRAKAISTNVVWGVHLGSNRGRVSGLKFGYSQVVNPWYLMTKGVLKPRELCQHVLFGLGANALGVVFSSSHIDRYGRLKGNMIGIKDIILNRWAPERIVEF
jgi:glycosyltransferase involved in cell wall biosynthesis